MLRDEITLYFPGDGVCEGSNSCTYNGIKDFKDNKNGTVTFKTLKHGTVTTAAIWRLKVGVEAEEPVIDNLPAGNMERNRRGY